MEKLKSKYLLYLLWVAGFVVISFLIGRLEESIEDQMKMSFFIALRWVIAGLNVIWGGYIGLIFIKSLKIKINWSFLGCVVLPLFMILVWQMIRYSIYLRLDLQVLALACGATLVYSLFSRPS
ncbi:hypothetical protein [Paenibacillus medicaginis]|uniref:EamA domain-containing protein n=1 Tax=Paenibacillus medicaginis TaxID=1470560 RepID=A0ABV5BWC7_9BACL